MGSRFNNFNSTRRHFSPPRRSHRESYDRTQFTRDRSPPELHQSRQNRRRSSPESQQNEHRSLNRTQNRSRSPSLLHQSRHKSSRSPPRQRQSWQNGNRSPPRQSWQNRKRTPPHRDRSPSYRDRSPHNSWQNCKKSLPEPHQLWQNCKRSPTRSHQSWKSGNRSPPTIHQSRQNRSRSPHRIHQPAQNRNHSPYRSHQPMQNRNRSPHLTMQNRSRSPPLYQPIQSRRRSSSRSKQYQSFQNRSGSPPRSFQSPKRFKSFQNNSPPRSHQSFQRASPARPHHSFQNRSISPPAPYKSLPEQNRHRSRLELHQTSHRDPKPYESLKNRSNSPPYHLPHDRNMSPLNGSRSPSYQAYNTSKLPTPNKSYSSLNKNHELNVKNNADFKIPIYKEETVNTSNQIKRAFTKIDKTKRPKRSLRIYIVEEKTKLLTKEQSQLIQRVLEKQWDEALKTGSDNCPSFFRWHYEHNKLLICCANKASIAWVKEIVPHISAFSEECKLIVVPLGKINKQIRKFVITKCSMVFPKETSNSSAVMERLTAQNDWVDISKWEVLNRRETPTKLTLIIGIPKEHIAVVKEYNDQLNFRSSVVTINFKTTKIHRNSRNYWT